MYKGTQRQKAAVFFREDLVVCHLFQGSFFETQFQSGVPIAAPATNMRMLHQVVPRISAIWFSFIK
jgi:hypothetical protein